MVPLHPLLLSWEADSIFLFLCSYGMVHKLICIIKLSYSDYEEFYNSNNGKSHKMRIKGRKEFIPYALFEAFKARDERLELVPHYRYYLEFQKEIAVAIYALFFSTKSYSRVSSCTMKLIRFKSSFLVTIPTNSFSSFPIQIKLSSTSSFNTSST